MAGPPTIREPQLLTLERERLRAIFYGDPGVGKTTLALTFPRPVVIDTDGGLISAAVQGARPLVYEPSGYKDLEGLYHWLKQRQDQYDTIVIDSVPTMQRLLLDEIHDQGLAAGKDPKPVMVWVPEQGEYQAQQRQMARILTDLRRLGKHMVITAGVRDRMGKRSLDVSPGLFNILNYWASLMGELTVITHDNKGEELAGGPRRLLITGPGPRETKSRFRSLLPGIWNPTFEEIWGRVMKEYERAEKAVTDGKTGGSK